MRLVYQAPINNSGVSHPGKGSPHKYVLSLVPPVRDLKLTLPVKALRFAPTSMPPPSSIPPAWP